MTVVFRITGTDMLLCTKTIEFFIKATMELYPDEWTKPPISDNIQELNRLKGKLYIMAALEHD